MSELIKMLHQQAEFIRQENLTVSELLEVAANVIERLQSDLAAENERARIAETKLAELGKQEPYAWAYQSINEPTKSPDISRKKAQDALAELYAGRCIEIPLYARQVPAKPEVSEEQITHIWYVLANYDEGFTLDEFKDLFNEWLADVFIEEDRLSLDDNEVATCVVSKWPKWKREYKLTRLKNDAAKFAEREKQEPVAEVCVSRGEPVKHSFYVGALSDGIYSLYASQVPAK